jgi:hypothetical protein
MPHNPVVLAREMAPLFDLKTWDALSDGERGAVADHLTERLAARGWEVEEPLALRRFGPPESPRSVLQWRDPRTRMTFSLIPGGTFRPGYGPELLARYHELCLRVEGVEYTPSPSRETPVFASERPYNLRRKPPVKVRPLLMACELVPAILPGVQDGPDRREGGGDREDRSATGWEEMYPYLGDNLSVRWPRVEAVLGRFGWALPSSAEFEWALRGGVDSLFYWGDEPPDFVGAAPVRGGRSGAEQVSFDAVMSSRFDPDRERAWPWCNRFGLAAMLAEGTWCAPATAPGDQFPLIVRGGAACFYPWQDCGEWVLLLNAVESRLAPETDYADHNAIRPVIRLDFSEP